MKTTSENRGISLNDTPGAFPGDHVPQDVDLDVAAAAALSALKAASPDDMHPEILWKDWLCLTGQVVTTHSPAGVSQRWRNAVAAKQPTNFQTGKAMPMRMIPGSSWVNVSVTFDATHDDLCTKCGGYIAVVPNASAPQGWQIWMLTTWLENFDGHGHPDIPQQPKPTNLVPDGPHQTLTNDLSVLVIGSGQQGLNLAARLQALGIDYVVLEQGPHVANAWMTRYDSAKLHTTREVNNLPFGRTWAADAPDWLPARQVAEGFQQFVRRFGIHVWTQSQPISCVRAEGGWLVKVQRGAAVYTIRAGHVALGMGVAVSGPKMPSIKNQDRFQGQVLHSATYKNAAPWKGKRGVIVGVGTSAFDIAQDMADAGLSEITMVQRGATAVFSGWQQELGQAALFNMRIPTAVADRMIWPVPQKIAMNMTDAGTRTPNAAHARVLDGLEQVGFRVDRESKLNDLILNRFGGYYPDVGATALLIDGRVKVKSGVPIAEFTAQGLRFEDGDEVGADVVLFATGFEHNMAVSAGRFMQREDARHLEDIWGIDANGDLKGILKPALPGLWPMVGGIPQSRWFSQFIALRMQAELLGKPIVADGL